MPVFSPFPLLNFITKFPLEYPHQRKYPLANVFRFVLLLLMCVFSDAQAYPQFVVHGYTTCMACHYNPMGNGPLTDYGRALGATVISRRPFWIKEGEEADEKAAEQSGFLGPVAKLPYWIRPAFDYRGLHLVTGLQDNSTSRWIDMQTEGSVTLQTRDAKLIATVTYGLIPVPRTAPSGQRALYATSISREHYIGWRGLKRFHFYAGLMDPAFGLRIAEHNAYVRSLGGRNINDQNHGVLVNMTDKKWDLYVNAVIGNLQQASNLRQKGVIASYERELFERARFGASVWYTSNELRYRRMFGLYGRMGLGKNGMGLLGELTLMKTGNTTTDEGAATGQLSFLQATMNLDRGWYFLFTFQNAIPDFKSDQGRQISAGPTLQYFPVQRLELRADLLTTRSLSSRPLAADDWSALLQVHVWL
jgi:hypothetical protein